MENCGIHNETASLNLRFDHFQLLTYVCEAFYVLVEQSLHI